MPLEYYKLYCDNTPKFIEWKIQKYWNFDRNDRNNVVFLLKHRRSSVGNVHRMNSKANSVMIHLIWVLQMIIKSGGPIRNAHTHQVNRIRMINHLLKEPSVKRSNESVSSHRLFESERCANFYRFIFVQIYFFSLTKLFFFCLPCSQLAYIPCLSNVRLGEYSCTTKWMRQY